MKMLSRTIGPVLGVLFAVMAASPGSAAGLRCKSDPTVLLSNGTVVDLTADIGAPLWDVRSVEYTIHVPAGLGVLAVATTPNWPTTREKFAILADQAPGVYLTTTVAKTVKRVDVTAQLIVNTAMDAARGWSGEQLHGRVVTK